MSAPILVPPRYEGQYVLDTDASDTALGAVLQQEQDGQLRVIGYASCAVTNAERRYSHVSTMPTHCYMAFQP